MASAQGLRGGLVAQIKVKHITARLADMDLSVLSRKGVFFFFFPPSNKEAIKKRKDNSICFLWSFLLTFPSPGFSLYLSGNTNYDCTQGKNNICRQLFSFSLTCSGQWEFFPRRAWKYKAIKLKKKIYILCWNKISSFTGKIQKNNMLICWVFLKTNLEFDGATFSYIKESLSMGEFTHEEL